MKRRHITLVRSASAHLPEIDAYQDVLSAYYDVSVVDEAELKSAGPFDILWLFMDCNAHDMEQSGLCTIIDRSPPGDFPISKTESKKGLNGIPDLRVFLTPEIEQKFAFRDQVPSVCLDMGVPSFMLQRSHPGAETEYDFCYIGSISRLRGIPEMLEAFVKSTHAQKKLILVGHAEADIVKRYASENVIFAGAVAQTEVKSYIESSGCCICKIPEGYPYDFQTPTKLLEYAALGKRILANTSACNQKAAHKYGIDVTWCSDRIFDTAFDLMSIPENRSFDPHTVSWSNVIHKSGVFEKLDEILRHG